MVDDVRVAMDDGAAIEASIAENLPQNGGPLAGSGSRDAGRTTTLRPGPMPTPVSVPRSTPYSPRPLVPDATLAARIAQLASGHTGKLGIAIEDLETGRGVLIDPDTEYQAASLFKLSVMYEVFKQRELGFLSFDEVLVVTERHVSYDLGTLDRSAGSTIRLGEALERMIVISDNSSAIMLTDRVGAININQDLRSLGLMHTRLVADDLVTSPGDMLLFLQMLARGQGVNEKTSAEMVQLMARQRVNDRIPRLLPADTIVAHKTGNLPGVVNDVGIVYAPDASFIVAVLADGTSNEGRAAQITAEIAAAAYEYFRQGATPDVNFPTPGPTNTPRPIPPTPIPAPTTEPTATSEAAPTETRTPRTPTATELPLSAAPTEAPTGTSTVGPTATVAAALAATPAVAPTVVPAATPPTPSPEPAALSERRPDAAPQR